jgi:hypothetical protein
MAKIGIDLDVELEHSMNLDGSLQLNLSGSLDFSGLGLARIIHGAP